MTTADVAAHGTVLQTWTNMDKSRWTERGPWDSEPDKAQWVAHGLDCLIVRNQLGGLCGYVGVPESHPYFGKGYGDHVHDDRCDAEPGDDLAWHHKCTPCGRVDVHGGLTFTDRCEPVENPAEGICHVDAGAANKVVWWLGFDCGHCGDLLPGMSSRVDFGRPLVYRDLGYVQREVEMLAEQLVAISAGTRP